MIRNLLILTIIFTFSAIVVDSCSSFTSWKVRHVDAPHKHFEMTTEANNIETNKKHTKTIDNTNTDDDAKSSKNDSTTIKKVYGERCAIEFEKFYCFNQGRCYMIENGGAKEAHCVCKPEFTGPQCMQKNPDGQYNTKKHHRNSKTPRPSTIEIDTTISPQTLEDERLAKGGTIPCPPPYDKDYCGEFGECFVIPALGEQEYYCNCNDHYAGSRCEQKVVSDHYETLTKHKNPEVSKRKRRSAIANSKRWSHAKLRSKKKQTTP